MTNIDTKTRLGNAELQDALDAPISRSNRDQDTDQNNQRAAFARICAAIIPYLCTDGYSWSGFTDFSPAAVDWLRTNQIVVRSNRTSSNGRERPSNRRMKRGRV